MGWGGPWRTPHGTGDLILPNGSVHEGLFNQGRAQGAGTFYDATGSVSMGHWVDNKRVGDFKVWDPKMGEWKDVYDEEGKRTSRKKSAPPPPDSRAAGPCRHCGVKFHARFNSRCRQHSGKWMAASETNADGSAAVVDRVAFPDGGLWLCCGSKVKSGGERCTLGRHETALPAAPSGEVPEGRRIEEVVLSRTADGEVVISSASPEDGRGANSGPGSKPAAHGEQDQTEARIRVPSFIQSTFTSKVEYEAWVMRERGAATV